MEKYLTVSDVRREFLLPAEWLRILPEGPNAVVWAVDGGDVNWTFHCCRTGRYFQSKEWLQFVRHKRLTAGDKIVIGKEEHPFLGPRYRIRAEKWIGGLWVDVDV